jgi:hypothetical protein
MSFVFTQILLTFIFVVLPVLVIGLVVYFGFRSRLRTADRLLSQLIPPKSVRRAKHRQLRNLALLGMVSLVVIFLFRKLTGKT